MKSDIVPHEDHYSIVERQADTDEQVISLWLHGLSKQTQRVYMSDIKQFVCFTNKLFTTAKLRDLQEFSDSLVGRHLKPSTIHRILSAVKSLFSFAHKIGYLKYDVSRPLKLPKFKESKHT